VCRSDVPAHLVELAVAHLLLPVLVGRHYPRFGRREQRVRHRGVPVCSPYPARRGGAPVLGFVCCHTAINMLAWLLYPQSVYDRHISRRDCLPPASTSRSAGTPDSTAATCCRPPKGSFEIFSREGESK